MKRKITNFKRMLLAVVAVMSAAGAWATEDLANRTTPNNELFYACSAGLAFGGTYTSTNWNLTANKGTRQVVVTLPSDVQVGDQFVLYSTKKSNASVSIMLYDYNSSTGTWTALKEIFYAEGVKTSDGVQELTYTVAEGDPIIGKTEIYVTRKDGDNGSLLKAVKVVRSGADDLRPNALTGISKTWDFEGFNTETTTSDIVNNDLFYKTGVIVADKTSDTYTKAVELAKDKYLAFFVPAGTGKVEIVCSSGNERNIRKKVGEEDVVTLGSVQYSNKVYTFGYTVTEETPIVLSGSGSNRCYVHAVKVYMNNETATLDGTYGYASYSCVNDINVDGITASTGSVTVYKAISSDESKVTMESVSGKVPAGTGLILKGTPGATITIPYTTEASALDGTNLLKAVSQSGSLTSSTAPDGTTTTGTNYVLSVQYSKVVFASITEDAATMKAGQAYLNIPSSARSLSISFGDDETTGVQRIVNRESDSESYYNLQGQRVAQPTKGLYVVNGKKVIIK